jgi:hypothetical protein
VSRIPVAVRARFVGLHDPRLRRPARERRR